MATVTEASEIYLFLLGPLIMIIFKTNKTQLNQDPSFQRKRTLDELQMFNIILSICTPIYWFKHCNVSRSTSFMKAFCRLLTSQSTTSLPWVTMVPLQMPFQSHTRKFACTSFHIGGFLFVRYGHKASWNFLIAYFWFCWLLISFPLHHLFCIALSSPWLAKRVLVYMLLSIGELVNCHFVFAHLALRQRQHVIHDAYTSSSSL